MAKVSLIEEETIKASVNDINYIPSYKIAEEERRKNELERIDNEEERVDYYQLIQEKVNNGEFNGADGEQGEKGDTGEKGERGSSIYLTTQKISESSMVALNKMFIISHGESINVGDLVMSTYKDSMGSIGCVTLIEGNNIGYTYYGNLKGDVGPQGEPGKDGANGQDGEDGDTPDMTNYYNKDEIDTMIGDIESLLSEV